MRGDGKGFGRIALRGGIVTGAAQAAKIALQLASVVVLARLLEPSDFGLIASVAPLVAFIALFQDLGFQQAVIQKQDITDAQLNKVFWVTVAAGVASTFAVVTAAPLTAKFYGDDRLFWISIAMSVPLLLGSLAALPLSLLARRMQFGYLAANDVVGTTTGVLAAASAAYAGFGYWSLVIGTAVPALTTLGMATWSAGWRPDKPDFRIDRGVMSFGANLTGFNVVNFLARNADNVLIGKSLGAIELGFYDRAYKLFLSPLVAINAPLARIMLPIFARIQDDKPRLRNMFLQVNWLIAAATIPAIATLGMTSEETVSLLFGTRWMEAAPILSWLALAGLFQPLSNASGWLFISQGKTKEMLRWGIYSSTITLISFVGGLPWGATGVAAAYAISGHAFRVPVLVAVLHRIGPVRATDLISIKLLFLTSAMAAWFICKDVIRPSGGDVGTIFWTAAVNYALAAILLMAFPVSRKIIIETLCLARKCIRNK